MRFYELKGNFASDFPYPARKDWHIGFYKTAKRAGQRAKELIEQYKAGPGEMTGFSVTEHTLED